MEPERGAVYVEFLIVVIPFLLMFFGLSHLGLLYAADLLVSHAAAKAVRAAIVILPDEYGDYDGVEPNHIGTGGEGLDAYRDAPDGGRLEAIRKAARYAVAPIAPRLEIGNPRSLAEAIGDSPTFDTVANLLVTSDLAVAVTFPDGGGGYLTELPSRGLITARVTVLYRCGVPIMRSLVCHSYDELPDRAKQELATVGVSPLMGMGTQLLSWRFVAITAERTHSNQGK